MVWYGQCGMVRSVWCGMVSVVWLGQCGMIRSVWYC